MSKVAEIQKKLGRLDALLLTDAISVRYATGFALSDATALIGRKEAWLITDSRYIEAAEAAVTDMRVLCATVKKPAVSFLKEIMKKKSLSRVGAEESRLSISTWKAWEKQLGLSLKEASSILSGLRPSKTEDELENLIAAQRIAERALEDMLGLIRPGQTEQELAAELVYRLYKYGGEANSFDPIVLTGSKTSMPHGVPGDRVVQAGDFVTMDFGTIKNGYCSDMTRTVAVGSATEEMRRVYDIVLRAQQAGIEAARPGVKGVEVDGAARRVIEGAGYGPYFGHSFGHGIGLQIHEEPNASPRNRKPLPEGAVISAEPGIYLPGRFGVRIEDMLWLHGDGCRDLTLAPKELLIL